MCTLIAMSPVPPSDMQAQLQLLQWKLPGDIWRQNWAL